jgi:hypothetical protein
MAIRRGRALCRQQGGGEGDRDAGQRLAIAPHRSDDGSRGSLGLQWKREKEERAEEKNAREGRQADLIRNRFQPTRKLDEKLRFLKRSLP